MLATLGLVAREVREAAGLTQLDIAITAEVSDAVISNLERGVRYPEKLDPVVKAYEQECGLPANDLWKRAVALLD